MRDDTAHAHLTTTKDETLLWWRYTRLLLDLLLNTGDLDRVHAMSVARANTCTNTPNLVIKVDIKLDLRITKSQKAVSMLRTFRSD